MLNIDDVDFEKVIDWLKDELGDTNINVDNIVFALRLYIKTFSQEFQNEKIIGWCDSELQAMADNMFKLLSDDLGILVLEKQGEHYNDPTFYGIK